jgi:hypothetical protein
MDGMCGRGKEVGKFRESSFFEVTSSEPGPCTFKNSGPSATATSLTRAGLSCAEAGSKQPGAVLPQAPAANYFNCVQRPTMPEPAQPLLCVFPSPELVFAHLIQLSEAHRRILFLRGFTLVVLIEISSERTFFFFFLIS